MLVPLLTTPIETLGVDFIFGGAFASLVEQCTDEERCIVACAVGEYLLAHNIQLTSKENLALLTKLFSTIFSQTDPNCYSVLSRVLRLVKLEDDKAQQEVPLFPSIHGIVSLAVGFDPRCSSRFAFLWSSSAHHYLPLFGIPEIDPRSRIDLFVDRFCAGRAPKDPRPPSHGGHDGSNAHRRFAKRFFLR